MIQMKDEAKKWAKLQNLSKSFLQNRKQFMDAIDQYQLRMENIV